MLGRYTLSRPIRELGLLVPFATTSPFRTVAPTTTTIRSPFSTQRITWPTWTRPVPIVSPAPAPQPVTGSTIVSGEAIQAEVVQNAVTNEAQNGSIVGAEPQPDVTPESTVETGPLPEDDSMPSSVLMTEEPASGDNQAVSEAIWADYILEGGDEAAPVEIPVAETPAVQQARAEVAKKEKTKKVVRNVGIGAGIAAVIAAIAAAVR